MAGQQTRAARSVAVATVAASLASIAVRLEFGRAGVSPLTGATPMLVGLLGVVLVIAELRPPSWLTFGDQNVSLSWVVSLSIVLCGATAGALILTGLATLIRGVTQRELLSSTVFNSAQVTVSLACGIWVLRLTGALHQLAPGQAPHSMAWDLALVGAGAAVYVANAAMVAGAFWVVRGAPFVSTLREGLRVNVAGDGVLMALAPVVVAVGQRSLVLLPFVAMTGFGVYGVARLAMRHGHAATHDPLTGLANRRGFDEQVGELLERGGPTGLTVLVIDLDRFKPVNDRYGHATGDAVLVEVAQRLRSSLPTGAVVSRLGGDEFAAAVRTSTEAEAHGAARRVLDSMVDPVRAGGETLQIGASIGGAHGHHELSTLLAAADAAMYRAKTRRLGVCVVDAGSTQASSEVEAPSLVTSDRKPK